MTWSISGSQRDGGEGRLGKRWSLLQAASKGPRLGDARMNERSAFISDQIGNESFDAQLHEFVVFMAFANRLAAGQPDIGGTGRPRFSPSAEEPGPTPAFRGPGSI